MGPEKNYLFNLFDTLNIITIMTMDNIFLLHQLYIRGTHEITSLWCIVDTLRKRSLTSKRHIPSPLEDVIPLKLNNAAQLVLDKNGFRCALSCELQVTVELHYSLKSKIIIMNQFTFQKFCYVSISSQLGERHN